MKTTITGLVAAGLIAATIGPASAERYGKQRRYYSNPSYDAPYGGTNRQLQNLRAYQRGGYYEHDSNALPRFSRPWFEQKLRESGN
jgi:hypothetical protein